MITKRITQWYKSKRCPDCGSVYYKLGWGCHELPVRVVYRALRKEDEKKESRTGCYYLAHHILGDAF